jgi:hypothetical protein
MKYQISFLTIIICLVLVGCAIQPQTIQKTNIETPEKQMEEKLEEITKEITEPEVKKVVDVDRFENAHTIILKDVSGGNAQGEAWVVIENNKTYHKAVATNLPELTNNDFYEGWLVRKTPFDFFSTGEMLFDEKLQTWILKYETEGDKSDYTQVVITLEPDDGDPAPAKHIIEN